MRDPLRGFEWRCLYDRYDRKCRGFCPATEAVRFFTPAPQSDRELYYCLIDGIHGTGNGQPSLSIALYVALLYWKLYSCAAARANIARWFAPGARRAQSTSLRRLLSELPCHLDPDVKSVVDLVEGLGPYEIYGMKSKTALPVRTTFLHFLFPEVVPIFDRMVLRAVGVCESEANQSVDCLREYLPFAWDLAAQHAPRCCSYRESSVRLVDMALWAVRD